ncbi:XdhC family protein [Labrenzia sp. PHM005]|uniref:XdhC family protein n=1 Tax=Labrenzia sp. PHM005 TaxID=2590016 RepID=UPI00113FD03A|nr:XdhC family protein [Labrenzia sp. PHM005]QDG74663.1 XdhC family protein [Labrenzia sp. PHM005]
MDFSLLSQLNAERAARRAAILVTEMADGRQRLIQKDKPYSDDPLAEEFGKRFRSGKSGIVETVLGEAFLTVSVPAPRLVIIGAVHISQALVPMAKIAGFDVTVIDPRTAFATEDRFPGSSLIADWPEDVLKDRPLDPYTAVAAVTHDPKIDDFPLMEALKTGCFYVGALGSRKTHGKRLDRFREAGISEGLMNRIEAPIGLDIGSASPEEIAVSVLGSIIKALRKPLDKAT